MKLTLNSIFSDNAVFPHAKPIRIYGNGEGSITARFGENELQTVASNGEWSITIPPMECSGPYTLVVTDGETSIELNDIYVGEVILICGQSNSQFKLHETNDDRDSYKTNPLMRLYTVDRPEAGEFFKSTDGWVRCEAENAGNWSALGYYIADEISTAKNVAVGIIACYQGASMIQSWLPESEATKECFAIPDDQKHTDFFDFSAWNGNGFLYENMLKKLFPYSINRVVYYQGESNTTQAEGAIYDQLLLALIEVFRRGFRDHLLPITVVQIADLDNRNDEGWKSVQRAQLKVTHLAENVRTVICADISETDNIHPPTKKPLALRIAKSFE